MKTQKDIAIARRKSFGDAPILVFCDHASNAIPADMNCLGLPGDILKTHIAYDIGAGEVAEALARSLGAQFLACGFSRLIIDANRDPAAGDLIPAVADQIPVPGNQMLTEEDREARLVNFHTPYHEELGDAIQSLHEKCKSPFIISVHSFTNRLMGAGEERPWPIGLLWRHDEPSARFMLNWLSQETGEPIGDNEPYDARLFNYSVDLHIAPRDISHVTFEVRQDLIGESLGVEQIASLLARGVGELRKVMLE